MKKTSLVKTGASQIKRPKTSLGIKTSQLNTHNVSVNSSTTKMSQAKRKSILVPTEANNNIRPSWVASCKLSNTPQQITTPKSKILQMKENLQIQEKSRIKVGISRNVGPSKTLSSQKLSRANSRLSASENCDIGTSTIQVLTVTSLDKSIDQHHIANKAKTPSMAKNKHMGSIKERIKKEFGVELQLNDQKSNDKHQNSCSIFSDQHKESKKELEPSEVQVVNPSAKKAGMTKPQPKQSSQQRVTRNSQTTSGTRQPRKRSNTTSKVPISLSVTSPSNFATDKMTI